MHYQRLALAASLAVLLSACTTTMAPIPGATSEEDMAAILMTNDEAEIAQGQAASTRATREEVRSFAQMLVTDHTAGLANMRDFFNREGVNAATGNAIAETLRANSQTSITNLGTYTGADFDRAFMQHQVDAHSWALNTVETAFLPSARTPEMRSMLTAKRAALAAHLDRARQILSGLR